MTDLTAVKAAARKAAFARRKEAHSEARSALGVAHLISVLNDHKGKAIAGYMPIRTEINPLPAMAAMAAWSTIGVPYIVGEGQALNFANWRPDSDMVDGPFGAQVPAELEFITPEVVVVPLVGFDRNGGRLGYGGGFYDRTLEGLRAARPTLAIGYAYSAQEAEGLPLEPTDQPLDAIVTDEGVTWF
ncbi:5-formyltetrahydrofolate cyclo-ligase [Aliiroseovarius halocynthiae]|uniref:5-formyltetrahydrofolate cyclo-ligase n=1 Tax=Aliiroseovarius halocynthiae TaxID=985055 RepID=A0A545STW2_9RHOB|nr:5-formyltetrahydrofolate cyclo-ligase [Aliiroseovarius halocynthiae]TQV68401.1 5-formyltetrahydrofolate cyclo-ligase [Aliiroseovarius halocynthiae]SMR70793.1 5-formyltetrahydrofolate cyclo-ligase [Aliiroseovarius halocynthiae]